MAFKDKVQENRYKNQWQRDNKDRIVLLPSIEDGKKLRSKAKTAGKTPTQYVIELMQRESP